MKTPELERLATFRQNLYRLFGRRRDALFEVLDALLTIGPTSSPAHLSLAPTFRRGWGSLYDALAVGQISPEAVESLLSAHPLDAGEPIYAVDVSAWARCDAETSPGHAYYYHPSRHLAGQPIVAGWAYQWLAQLSFAHESWTAPLSIRRLTPAEDSNILAAQQIKLLLQRLRCSEQVPIFVFDAGYDPVELALPLGQRVRRFWSGCGLVAAFTLTRRTGPKPDARLGMGRSWPVPTRRLGRLPPTSTLQMIPNTARFGCVLGLGCTRARRTMQAEGHVRCFLAPSSWWKSVACPDRPESPSSCGCGGMGLNLPIWLGCGVLMCTVSRWNIPFGSSNKP